MEATTRGEPSRRLPFEWDIARLIDHQQSVAADTKEFDLEPAAAVGQLPCRPIGWRDRPHPGTSPARPAEWKPSEISLSPQREHSLRRLKRFGVAAPAFHSSYAH